MRILLVEDDAVDRIAVRRALAAPPDRPELACELTERGSVAEAKEALAEGAFDCVLLDWRLPDGDGLEVLGHVLDRGLDVPVLMLTGQGDENLAAELMKRGAADYLPKAGLRPESLRQRVRAVIRLVEAERQRRDARALVDRNLARLARLAEAGIRINRAGTLEGIARATAEEAQALVDAGRVVVRLPRPSLEPVEATWPREDAAAGGAPEDFPIGDGGAPAGADGPWLRVTPPAGAALDPSDRSLLAHLGQLVAGTLRKSALVEEAREAASARDEMLAVVSHDLRNPLNNVTMAVSLLRSRLGARGDAAAEVDLVDRAERSLQRMSRLIEDLLDASRIEAGHLKVEPVPIAATALLRDAHEAHAALAKAKGIALELAPGAPELTVPADRDRLLQVFSNLIGNALKFTPAGGAVTLSLAPASDDAGRPAARFAVADTGVGIAAEHVGHLFTRFWKVRGGSKEGAGLGLYIAKGIVEAHRGTIRVASEPGRGTRFEVTLPVG